jgi:ribosome-associated toxin RatA of RatAB toxin-antitoxin module
MRLSLREGPFRDLSGHWRFQALGDSACKVELMLSYSFANPLLEGAVGPVFAAITETLIERFSERAERLFGGAANL